MSPSTPQTAKLRLWRCEQLVLDSQHVLIAQLSQTSQVDDAQFVIFVSADFHGPLVYINFATLPCNAVDGMF